MAVNVKKDKLRTIEIKTYSERQKIRRCFSEVS